MGKHIHTENTNDIDISNMNLNSFYDFRDRTNWMLDIRRA
jgi:hypothetical protein